MNISDVKIRLTTEDIKSIIDDFIHIPGLNINVIKIDKHIHISGSFKKIVTIPFNLEVRLERVEVHSVLLKLQKVEVAKIPVFRWIRNLALKKIIKTLQEFGLNLKGELIELYLPKVMKKLPVSMDFSIDNVKLDNDMMCIELEKIKLNIGGTKAEALPEAVEKQQSDNGMKIEIFKSGDTYNKVRKRMENAAPEKYKEMIEYLMIMPDIAALFIRLFKDKRVPVKSKLICGAVIAYFALPIDILPDFIPIIGSVDDFALAFYALDKILCSVPEEVIKENWQGKEDIIVIIRKGIDFIRNIIGTNNLVKGYRWLIKAVKPKTDIAGEVEKKEKMLNGKESIRN